jgi:predicted dehydrogenase
MKRNFAIIGCGRIAQRHAEQINRVGELIAVCDLEISKAELLANQFNAKSYMSVDEMLKCEPTIEIVSVCSPNYLHKEHTILALNAEKDVLCEKPLAIKVSDAEDMIEAAKKNNRKLYVVKSSRFNYYVKKIKELIENNTLGKIYTYNLNMVWNRPISYFQNSWKGTIEKDGGILFTQFSHYIDSLIWLLGDVDSFSGFRSNRSDKKIESEDSGAIALKMKSGVIGTMHYTINAFEKNQEISLNIIAENATIKIGGEFMHQIIYQNPDNIFHLENEMESKVISSMSNHEVIYDNLILAINNSSSSLPSADSAIKCIQLIENIYKTIRN